MSERRRRFIKNGIMLGAVGLLTRSVALFFSSYLARAIGAEGMGLFGLVSTVYAFGVTFATSGVSLTVTKLTSSAIGRGEEGELSRIFRAAVFYSLIFSAFAFCVLFLFSDYLALRVLGDLRAGGAIRVLSFSLVPLAVSSTVSGYFVGVRRVSRNAVVTVLSQGLRIFLTVFLISRESGKSAERGVYIVALVMTLTEIFSLILSLFQYFLDRLKAKRGRGSHFLAVCNMALPLAASAYVRSALLTLEHALIPHKLTQSGASQSEALSHYGALHGMALPLLLFPMSPLSSLAGLLVPEFSESAARGDRKKLAELAREALSKTLAYAVIVASVLFTFSEELGYLFFSSYEAGRHIAALAPVVPLMYLDHVTDAMLKGIGEQVYSMWVNVTDSVLSLVLVAVLIPPLGITGYSLVILIMEAYNFTLSFVRLRKIIPFKMRFFSSALIPLVFALVGAFVADKAFIHTSSNTSILGICAKISFTVSVYIFLLLIRPQKKRRQG